MHVVEYMYDLRVKNFCAVTKMSNASKTKISRSGCWEPYIPTMGVPRGCRTGTRNESEIFNIHHISRQYEDDSIQRRENTRSPQIGTASSFESGSLVPKADNSVIPSFPSVAAQRYASDLYGSLKPGLIASCDQPESHRRSHAGRITQSSLLAGLGVEHESEQIISRPRRRINSETFVPPDNIGRGLRPDTDFSQKPGSIRAPSVNHPSTHSLGQGLIPLGKNILHNESDSRIGRMNKHLDGEREYKRVYGLLPHPIQSVT